VPEPASLPLGEYTFYPADADSTANDDLRVNRVSTTTFPSLIIPHRPYADPAQQAKTQAPLLPKRHHRRGN
jgi:hypothetical protein